MNRTARRLLSFVPAARRSLVLSAALSTVAALLVVAQAGVLAGIITDAFLGGAGLARLAPGLAVLAAVVTARAAVGWAAEVTAARTAALVVTGIRARLLDSLLVQGPRSPGPAPTGQAATLVGRGVDGLDGYVGRHLPQRLVAVVVPLVVAVRILAA